MKFGSRFLIPVLGITIVSGSTLASDMLSVSGHARTRGELVDNQGGTKTDASERWLNRVRLNLDVTPTKSLQVRLSPELAHQLGNTAAAGAVTPLATAADPLTVREAWMSWQASDMFKLFAGRQVLTYGRGLLIGTSDDFQGTNFATGKAAQPIFLDAIRGRLSFDLGDVDVLYAKINDTAMVAGVESADHDVWGFYAMLKPDMGVLANLDVYFMWNDNRVSGANRSRIGYIGLRADGEAGVLFYNAEAKVNMGKAGGVSDTRKGIDLSAEVGATLMDEHKAALELTYVNSEASSFATDDGRALGRANLAGRQNIIGFGIHTDWTLHEKWSAYLDGTMAIKAKKASAAEFAGVAANGTGKFLGMEGSLGLVFQAEKNLAIDASYTLGKAGAAFVTANRKAISLLQLGGTLTF